MTEVMLKSLIVNPMRDLKVDPLDEDRVAELHKSIKAHGFWSGVSARKTKTGKLQVAAGWTRVQAAIQAGVSKADIYIGDFSDAEMIQVYARENATQHGNLGTTQAGSVAAALKYGAKCVLTGELREFSEFKISKARGQMTTEKGQGLGQDIILELLNGIPGINEYIVKQQLANLRSSGNYARILEEVKKEIDANAAYEQEVYDLATKAYEKAAARKVDFDHKGVSEHLKNPSHVDRFRKLVTGEGAKAHLTLEQQAPLAKAIVDSVPKDKELSARYIDEFFMGELMEVKGKQHKIDAAEREALLRADWNKRANVYMCGVARGVRSALAEMMKLRDHLENRPASVTLQKTDEYKTAMNNARNLVQMADKIEKKETTKQRQRSATKLLGSAKGK